LRLCGFAGDGIYFPQSRKAAKLSAKYFELASLEISRFFAPFAG
jgi:hypothetical protein